MDNGKIIGVALMFIFSFFFLKEGITGMYVFQEEDLCKDNTQCLLPRVCCEFYEEDSGVCNWQDNCNGIYLTSKKEKLKLTEGSKLTQEQIEGIAFKIDQPKKIKENSPLIIIGLLFFILATLYLINRQHMEKKKIKNKGKEANSIWKGKLKKP